MIMIDNGNSKIELRASAGAYRKLKFLLGVSNLKAAFFDAYQSVDVDFLLHVVEFIVGNVNLKQLSITLCEKTDTSEAVILTYGAFLQNVLDFVLVAFSIFIAIKVVISLKKKVIKEV